MKKRYGLAVTAIGFAALVVCASLACGLIFAGREHINSRGRLEEHYRQNLLDASKNLDRAEENMAKLIISADPAASAVLLADTRLYAAAASQSLGCLPLNEDDKTRAQEFLSGVSDWCAAPLPDCALRQNQAESYRLQTLRLCEELKSATEKLNKRKPLNGLDGGALNSFDGGTLNGFLAGEFINQPPKIAQKTEIFRALEGFKEVSAQDAIAETEQKFAFLGLRSAKIVGESVSPAAYLMQGKTNDGQLNLKVSKNGAFILSAAVQNSASMQKSVQKSVQNSTSMRKSAFVQNSAPMQKSVQNSLSVQKSTSTQNSAPMQKSVQNSAPMRKSVHNSASVQNSTSVQNSVPMRKSASVQNSVPVQKNGGGGLRRDRKIVYGKEFANKKAQKYAFMCGYENLSAVDCKVLGGAATVRLAPKIGGAVCYTDLVEVKIDLTSGQFLGLDALNYCACFCERNLIPSLKEQAAAQSLSPRLKIVGSRLALISKGGQEHLCYEFEGECSGLKYLVYIDAHTGLQVEIERGD